MTKRVMMVGKIGCGKTTLAQRLLDQPVAYQKTQSIQLVGEDIIDTPGEYMEQKAFYKALIVTAVEADAVLLLLDATDEQSALSPGMAGMFPCPVLGVVTKADLCGDPERLELCRELLELAGAEAVCQVGFGDDAGVARLRALLDGGDASSPARGAD